MISFLSKLFSNVFENPQAAFLPKSPEWERWLAWQIRNPLSAQLKATATDVIPNQPTFNPKGGWLELTHKSGLRFVSYRGPLSWPLSFIKIECYIGWRPDGVFGIAFRKANAKGY